MNFHVAPSNAFAGEHSTSVDEQDVMRPYTDGATSSL